MSHFRHSVSAESPGHSYPHSTSYSHQSDVHNTTSTPRRSPQSIPRSLTPKERCQDFENARAKFRSHRKRYERRTASGQTFVLADPLTAEVYRTGVMDEMRNGTNSAITPITPPTVLKDHLFGYTVVFYILVEISVPQLFCTFREHKVHDAQLPLPRDRLEDLVRQQGCKFPSFVERFLVEQTAWCPISFSSDMSLDQRNRIEPFYFRSPITSSRGNRRLPPNNASLFEVHIPGELLPEHTRRTLDGLGACIAPNTGMDSREVLETDIDDDKRYRVALKRFPSNKRETFRREKSAFEALRDQEGLIQYIASYQTTNDRQETHYNILLEYAELDLYQVIHREEPPVSSTEIKAFWDAMLGPCRSLQAIGKVDLEDAPYHVWHCDIKPENILRAGGRFKLADLGETRILKLDPDEQPRAVVTGGTMTYAAPEKAAYLNSQVHQPPSVSQNSDVWSLGAVLSDAATFVVLGQQGVIKYDLVRRFAILDATKKCGDAFHDGGTVLDAVKKWHEYLRCSSRRSDNLTPAILDLVDNHMLVDSQVRYDSAEVAGHLEGILKNTAYESNQAPSLIEGILEAIDYDPKTFRERSRESTATSLGTISTRDIVATDDGISESKYDLLNQQILPTAPKGGQGIRRRDTARNAFTRTNTQSTARNGPPLAITTDATAVRNPEAPRGSYEEFYAPYTVFKLREDLDELGSGTKSKGRMFSRRRTSFFKSRQASVKGRWKAHEDRLVDAFNGRDIVFLVDNGSTMADHWQEATELLTTLVRRAIGYDDDGIELYFTSQKNMEKSAVPLSNQGVEDFTRAMSEERPVSDGYPTDIVTSLSSVMAKYIMEKKKPKTTIILTDGVWEGMRNESAVDELIIQNLKCLRTIHPDTAANGNVSIIEAMRPLTIQFVRFGQDPHALERLRRLDDCLVDCGVEDVVDCEPSGGDVYKMFLGSLLKEMDERENITNVVSPITPSVSRGPSLRNGNRGADDDHDDDDGGSSIRGSGFYA